MSKRPPDFSFERDGRSISAWLRELVAEDASSRLAAGEALQAMLYGVPSIHTDFAEIDWEASREIIGDADRFKDAVRAAVGAREFPTAEFVRRLNAHRIKLKDDWHRRVDQVCQRNQAPGVFEERLLQRLQAARDDTERTEATRRYLRWVFASAARDCKRNQNISAGAESLTAAGVMSSIVFGALDEALLTDRPGMWAMLGDESMFQDAAEALARIGPAAVDFAWFFLDRLSAQETPNRYDGAQALGSIGRDDPAVIDALLRSLATGSDPVRIGAAQALGHAGPPLAGRLEVALDLLLGATHHPELIYAATSALASVGRDREEALRRVLELAAPQPPRWRTVESYPEHRYDEVMSIRGIAIESLSHFRRFADRVTPVLVEAFDSFEEYNSDLSYHGENCRVCWALSAFGADAAPAVPRLVRYLEGWWGRSEADRVWPQEVFDLLASIGPSAAGALPALERFHAMQAAEDETPSDVLDPNIPLDKAILTLRGESK